MARGLSVKVFNGSIYVAGSSGGSCLIYRHGDPEILASLPSSWPCLALHAFPEGLLVSAGNALYSVSYSGDVKLLLEVGRGNWFWHAVEGGDGVYVQEYGEPPTGIYFSEDLRSFARLVTNRDIDPLSRHFHYIAYDASRDLLAVTLGDGNIVRVAVSGDRGRSWRALYKGSWQFVPILVEDDKWVLGFDSGIARGGVGVYRFDHEKWFFKFLTPPRGFPSAQFADLKKLGEVYIGALGQPQAIVVSRDLMYWYPVYVGGHRGYNYHASVEASGDKIVVSIGEKPLLLGTNDLEEAFKGKPFLTPYRALIDRARGLLFNIRRLPWLFRL